MLPKRDTSLGEDFIRTAAFLKREFEGRNRSVKFLEDHGDNGIIYVFDSDIIITKCAPWITGPLKDQLNGYGMIFDRQSGGAEEAPAGNIQTDRRAEAVASILASYLFKHHKKTSRGAPIFQFPSHSRETNNVYRSVRRTVESFETIDVKHSAARRNFEFARMAALIRHYAEIGATGDFQKIAENIVNILLYNDRPFGRRSRLLQEWDNYFSLEAEYGGIYPLSDAAAFFPNDPALANAFAVMHKKFRTHREEKIFQRLSEFWAASLDHRERQNVDADAEALSHLFLVNARLAGSRWKCVFVTGDRTLVRTAYRGIPSDLVDDGVGDLRPNFSLEAVRHLWAFTSDALIEPEKQQSFIDLFNGLLANWSDQLKFSTKILEALAYRRASDLANQLPENGVNRVLDEWEQLTDKAITKHSMAEYEKNERLAKAIMPLIQKSMKGEAATLQSLLQEEVDRIRDRTILSMSDLGFDVVIRADKLGRRNPPELIFESLKHTNSIFRKLALVDGYRDSKLFEADLARIKDECHDSSVDGDDRQESHLKFLVLGAAFASAERWLIAFGHARRAIDIIERSKRVFSPIPVKLGDGSRTHMSGREAYFLAAVSQRIIASSGESHEYEQALIYLEKASEALKEDRARGTAATISETRFKNERLAISLARFHAAQAEGSGIDQLVIVRSVFSGAKELVPILEEALTAEQNSLRSLRDLSLVNLATNLIQTFVIREQRRYFGHDDEGDAVSLEVVAKAVDIIEERTSFSKNSKVDRIFATMLIKTYTLVAQMFLAENYQVKVSLKRNLAILLQNIDDAIVTHYDKSRYQSLLDFVENKFPG